MTRAFVAGLALWVGFVPVASAEDEFELPPISYSRTTPSNRVSRLQDRLDRGELMLKYDERTGYLPSLLQALETPADSQMLVYSKTSLQRHRITPKTPRAIYFSDDVYVGFCRSGDVLEISAADPQLGAVFYTLNQDEDEKPVFQRQTDNCLLCHGGSQTSQIPGHLVRSVFVDEIGMPLLASGSVRVDQTTPIEKRWGGWYVTGKHGATKHQGNLIIRGRQVPEEVDNSQGQNVIDLTSRFDTTAYVVDSSDIVALMVFEHQAMAHNLITRLNFTTKQALAYQDAVNRELKQPPGTRWDSTNTRIRSATDALLKCLLFSGEASIEHPISGANSFAENFEKRGLRDKQGRSLRQFDLSRRMFKYPCSYLMGSEAVAALPEEARRSLRTRLGEVLTGADSSKDFAHLSSEDRVAILEILHETLPETLRPILPAARK